MTTVRKSTVALPTRSDGGSSIGPKLSLATVAPKTPNSPKTASSAGKSGTPGAERKMSTMVRRFGGLGMKDTASTADGAPSEDAASSSGGAFSKKNSIMSGASGLLGRPSLSPGQGPRMSLVGLMASRRFAKKLMGRAMEKRESTLGDGPPPVNYEPTYRMEPKMKFDTTKVLEVMKDVIDTRLQDMKYNKRIAPNMNRILGDEVKDRVKKLNFERFKIVVVVMIGEKKGQGLQVSSRCSWDDHRDNFVTHSFQNKHIFCSCSVYGVYHE